MENDSITSENSEQRENSSKEDQKEKPSKLKFFEVFIGCIVSIVTIIIAVNTFRMQDEAEKNNKKLKDIETKLAGERFEFERVRLIYDRTERYINSKNQDERWGRALVVLIKRVPDKQIRDDLLGAVQVGATSASVSNEAISRRRVENNQAKTLADFSRGFIYNKGDENKTDLTVYLCRSSRSKNTLIDTANDVLYTLKNSKKFGLIKASIWRNFDKFVPKKDTITFVFDNGHGEKGELENLRKLLDKIAKRENIIFVDEINSGKSTPWWIAIIVC